MPTTPVPTPRPEKFFSKTLREKFKWAIQSECSSRAVCSVYRPTSHGQRARKRRPGDGRALWTLFPPKTIMYSRVLDQNPQNGSLYDEFPDNEGNERGAPSWATMRGT
ncbi:hypothetical protein VTK56DRAFT_6613 [Thermocarpiscus australiensis]